MNNKISFGAAESPMDGLRITSDMVSNPVSLQSYYSLTLPQNVKKLCNQQSLGICTMCCVRKMAEQHFNDGVELSEYWGYLIGKVLIEGGLFYEGSAILYMLKAADIKHYGIPEKSMEIKYPLKIDGTYQQFVDNFNSRYSGKIPAEVLENAKKHMIPGYYQVNVNPISLASEIQAGRMLGMRFAVGENTYTDINGNVSWLASKLLPLRRYKHYEGGHAWPSYKHTGLGQDAKFAGLQSWSEEWCPDNTEDGAGHWNFIFNVQAPDLFTEAWAIMDSNATFIFTRDLTIGAEGPDVAALQKYLEKNGFMTMPNGVAYGYFGTVTKNGVSAYQKKNKISPAVGFFGPLTRNFLNKNQ